MAGQPRTLAETFRAWADSLRDELHVSCPAKVTAYDPLTNTIIAKPVVKRPVFASDGSKTYEDLEEIPFVQVQWPRAGGYVVTCPIEPGDTVLLVFSDFSLSEWRSNGEVAEPADVRQHSAGWPIAIPGVFPDIAPLSPLDVAARTAGMIIGKDGQPEQIRIQTGLIQIGHTPFGAPIEISAAGIKLGGIAAIDPVALATPTMAGISATYGLLTSICTALGALKTAYDGHTHAYAPGPGTPVPTTAPNNSAPAAPASPGTPAPVAALFVKAV